MSQLATFFDDVAAGYDRAFEDPGPEGHALRSRQEAVLGMAGKGGGEALDAGMGPGRVVAGLEARGWTASGIDLSPAMVDAARRRVPAAARRLGVGSIEVLPFEAASFDLVVATGVIEYVDAHRAVAELARVLRPAGRLVVSIPNPRAPYGMWRRRVVYPAAAAVKGAIRRGPPPRPEHRDPVALGDFAGILREAGLRVVAAQRVNAQALLTPLDELAPRAATGLAMRLERSGGRVARALSTQVMLLAQRDG
ncbi:MAG: methyltransferase domain-containing protein [Solirubrobacteraceae bacterium]